MNKLEKKAEYKKSFGLVILGIITCVLTAQFVGEENDIDLGRRLPTGSGIFLLGFLSIGWGLLKAFLTFLAFTGDENESQ